VNRHRDEAAKLIDVMATPERVRITTKDHDMDPRPGTILDVVGIEDDVTLVHWLGRRWPMLTIHTEPVTQESPRAQRTT
jgi:hypothetical protein